MTGHPRLNENDTEELPRELLELGRQIANLPSAYQADMGRVYEQVVDSARRRRRILALVQEALSQLRLDIKYLMFDLQVTRDERDALRQDSSED
jgi:argininosuccinate lyase